MKSNINNTFLWALLIFTLSLALGVSYVLFSPQSKLSPDAQEYDTLGWSLSRSDGYQIEPGEPDLTREPLYPFFLSIFYSLFGHNYFIVRVAQAAINALTCVLILLIGRRVFGHKAGLISALIASAYPAFIAYTGYILTENIFTFLLILAVFLLILGLERDKLKLFVGSGLAMGLAMLCKAVLLFFPLFISLLFILRYRKNKKIILHILAMFIAAYAVVLPWTMRNYKVSGALVPVRTGSGFNLWLGSYLPWGGENKAGGQNGYPEIRMKFIGAEPLKSLVWGLSPIAADKVLLTESMKNIKQDPLGYIKLCAGRTIKLWIHPIGEELIKNKSVLLARMLVIFHYAVLLFFIIGFLLSFTGIKADPLLVLSGAIFYFTAIYSIAYAHPRYQFPVLAPVLLFAVYGFISTADLLKKKLSFKKQAIGS
ncbi:MAG: glycosyltransferase family 39 protein [Candidatus Omnitrophica bacterium]|nr:glycosyltransferase family 39 protein [Candidatus Omnitrophota bacterium]